MRVAEAIGAVAARLRAGGLEGERRQARLLLGAALGIGQEAVIGHPDRVLEPGEREWLAALLDRRLRHEPLSRITGVREFWSLPFRVTEATLDPRPDSETVVQAVLASTMDRNRPLKILDLGVGTGCLLLALLTELPRARGHGIDCEMAAVEAARVNAQLLGLADRAEFGVDDWGGGQTGQYDVIVSNPPYVPSPEVASLPPSVSGYDPVRALDGGPDGFDCFRALAPGAVRLLAPGAALFVEIGLGQQSSVEAILRDAGLVPVGRHEDLAGHVRCLAAYRPWTPSGRAIRRGKKSVGMTRIPV